jgi:uncharacterized protein (TIGR03435 family)
MNPRHISLSTLLGAASLLAQPSIRPEFEVASIKPVNTSGQPSQAKAGWRIDGAQINISSMPLKDFVAMAYRVKHYQVSAPDWMDTEQFQIMASLPTGSSMTQIPEMLQALLEERFHLRLHRDKKDFPVYTLEVDKGGLRLQPLAPDATEVTPGINVAASGSAQGVAVNLGNGSSYSLVPNHFEVKKLGMTAFAANLERFVDRPVVDMTAAKGAYDFTLELTEEDYRGMLIHAAVNSGFVLPPQALQALETASLGSLFSALQKIGLRLESKKAPLDFLVVDSALKTPTEN